MNSCNHLISYPPVMEAAQSGQIAPFPAHPCAGISTWREQNLHFGSVGWGERSLDVPVSQLVLTVWSYTSSPLASGNEEFKRELTFFFFSERGYQWEGLANPARWRKERKVCHEKREGTEKWELLGGMELEVMERERGISRVGSSKGVASHGPE